MKPDARKLHKKFCLSSLKASTPSMTGVSMVGWGFTSKGIGLRHADARIMAQALGAFELFQVFGVRIADAVLSAYPMGSLLEKRCHLGTFPPMLG